MTRISLLGERGNGECNSYHCLEKEEMENETYITAWRKRKWRMTRISLLGERGNGE
jgi:hypothetical protein